jgi:hypothetical protein
MLRRFLIERSIPGIGTADREALEAAAEKSNSVLAQLAPRIQWEHSYVAGDKTVCVYLAEDEAVIHEHAKRSGFPATTVTEVKRIIDPTTAKPS